MLLLCMLQTNHAAKSNTAMVSHAANKQNDTYYTATYSKKNKVNYFTQIKKTKTLSGYKH